MQLTRQMVCCHLVALVLSAWVATAQSQQTIANPLIRPPTLSGGASASAQKAAGPVTQGATQGVAAQSALQGGSSSGSTDSSDSADIRRQAERRITQEDLNMRQQALNSPVLPQPLVALFSNMQVTAHVQGAIVMRKVDNNNDNAQNAQVAAPAASSNGQNNGRTESPSGPSVAQRLPSRSSGVLRLRVGRTENVNGYSLRAMVSGQDITVDWLSERGMWVNVFFGALESSSGGLAQVPNDAQLMKVETERFRHLVPELKRQTFSSSNGLGGGSGAGSGGFGGAGQGNNQPGFGSTFPN